MITQKELKKELSYNKSTGLFTNRVRRGKRARKNAEVLYKFHVNHGKGCIDG